MLSCFKMLVKFYTLTSDYVGKLEENAGFILGLSTLLLQTK